MLVAPQVTVPHREVSQQVGATTVLTCLVLTNPTGTFTWLRNGRKLVGDSKYEIGNWTVGEYQYMLAVTIHNLALSDYGTYRCVAENAFGSSQGDMSIFGMCASVFSTSLHCELICAFHIIVKRR